MKIIDIKIRIIRKMIRWRKWGQCAYRKYFERIAFTRQRREDNRKSAQRINKWIIPVIKTAEIHYSLNPEKAEEIFTFYEEYKNESVSI